MASTEVAHILASTASPGLAARCVLVAVIVFAAAACQRAGIEDCSVRCGPGMACPAGMVCGDGWCARTSRACQRNDGASESVPDALDGDASIDGGGPDADAGTADAAVDAFVDGGGSDADDGGADAAEDTLGDGGGSDAGGCPPGQYRNVVRSLCVPAHDLNGDGRSDLLAVNQAEHHALISDGEQFTFVKWLDGALHAVGGACAADVTGDGYADGIEFGSDFVGVVTRRGASFGNTRDDYAPWSPVGLLGTRGTFVADVDADGRADVVSLFEGQVTVARSNGDSFASAGRWLAGDFTDYLATFVADVDGDEMADVIGVRPRTIDVALSTGMSFTPATTWRDSKLVGRQGTFFADVDGDGRADGVRLELDGAWVSRSTGLGFEAERSWFDGSLAGGQATFVADADGDGRADVVAVSSSGVKVARSSGDAFALPTSWYAGQFRGDFNVAVAPAPAASYALAWPTTVGVFRPSQTWLLRSRNVTGDADIIVEFGAKHDVPVVGDWDGDGITTVGVFRPPGTTVSEEAGAVWLLRNANSRGEPDFPDIVYGEADDVPLGGDWDGDGKATVAVYRRPGTANNPGTQGQWFLSGVPFGSDHPVFSFGVAGDIPVVGDWDGNGTTTVGLYRPANQTWLLRNINDEGSPDLVFSYGDPGDLPVVGDWDANGTVTIGVFKPSPNQTSPAEWRLRNANSSGPADLSLFLGVAGDIPVTGRWAPIQ